VCRTDKCNAHFFVIHLCTFNITIFLKSLFYHHDMVENSSLQTQVLIIGSGIAGCTAALQLADRKIPVLLVTKSINPLESNTRYAQGGIVYKGKGDPTLLEKDVLKAGGKLCNTAMVTLLAEQGPQAVEEILLKRIHVPFTKINNTNFHLTKEGAHSTRRILHMQDQTGLSIEKQFMKHIEKNKYITLLKNHTLVDVLTVPHHLKKRNATIKKNICVGAYLLDNAHRKVIVCAAKFVVLATGGVGQLYLRTVNSPVARGDGVYAAYRAGAKLKHLEFIQFHPTSLYHKDLDNFLISEAVRGEGAQLKNKKGELFMNRFDKRGSLAPRDIVSRGIFKEMLDSSEPCVYLDIASYVSKEKIKHHFAKIYKTCKKYGLDITKKPLPVAPTAHFFCGGIDVDSWGRTSIKNMFAIGETSHTGIHGANRLASTSLLECLLWGKRCAAYIVNHMMDTQLFDPKKIRPWTYTHKEEKFDPALIQQDWITLKSIMWNYVGIIRTTRRLERAVKDLMYLQFRIDQFYKDLLVCDELIGLRNGVGTALIIAQAALNNKHSDGAHYVTKNYFKKR
jgi:L-aspartate oxidase